jgi:hypothetical protein
MTKKEIAFIKKRLKQEKRLEYLSKFGKTEGFTKDKKLKDKINKLEKGDILGFKKYVRIYESQENKKDRIRKKSKIGKGNNQTDVVLGGYLFSDEIFYTVLSYSSKKMRQLEEQLNLHIKEGYKVYANCPRMKRIVTGKTDIDLLLFDMWNFCEKLQQKWVFGDDETDQDGEDTENNYPLIDCEYERNVTRKTYKVLLTIHR